MDRLAFTADEAGLPVCLICGEKLANNKKSNVERHFQTKHTAFAKKNIQLEMKEKEQFRKADQSTSTLKRWEKYANLNTSASFVAAQEIARHRRPFTDGQYIKDILGYQNIYSRISKTRVKLLCKLEICLSLQRPSRTGP